MEGLTKQQLILLALLVSFVTSMATGIVSVALMDQAPKSVTQTINRVVQQTVEKVVPASNNSAAVITKETVVRSDDMVVAAVEQNKGNIFRITKSMNYGGSVKESFGALAIPVGTNNYLVTDISVLAKETDDYGSVIPESYKAIAPNGDSFSVIPVGTDQSNNLAFFKQQILSDTDKKINFSSVTVGNSNDLKLGQAVIIIGGQDSSVIGTGIVASLVPNDKKFQQELGSYSAVKTDISFSDSVTGTVLLNLSGELVGMAIGKVGGKSSYLPSNYISAAIAKIGTVNSTSTAI